MKLRKVVGVAQSKVDYLLILAFFIFSWSLMWKTFGQDSHGNIQMASKVWSDFAATIPLIRSFSLGSNFPPQYPIFAGPPIRYHFAFFLVIGLLERMRVPLAWALNVPSILGFTALLSLIYFIGKSIFKSRFVGLLSVVLFIFNGSLSFLEFFKVHPIDRGIVNAILTNEVFPSFGPYDGKVVSAFWNLNIYTNQRHLAIAYSAYLFLVYFLFYASRKPKEFTNRYAVILGIAVGLFPFVHMAVFGMLGIALLTALIIYPKLRKKIFMSGVIAFLMAIPQFMYMGTSAPGGSLFDPGYLVEKLTFLNFLKYWWLNLGITTFVSIGGFILAKKEERKFLIPFLVLFVIGNLFRFSSEMAANHKFFNLAVIGLNFFAAYFVVCVWRKKFWDKLLAVVLIFAMTLSGIIDIFPIFNDRVVTLTDIPNNKSASFIATSTPKDAVLLNASYLYDPSSLAGRRIYMGWPYFAWSAGYDTYGRLEKMKAILGGVTVEEICQAIMQEGIDYVEIENPTPLEEITINYDLYKKSFLKVFEDDVSRISIYDVEYTCKRL